MSTEAGPEREAVLPLAMLDQGFWPDGLYTQPSDAALVFDLKAQKDLGFNAVRKHIKVESPRWYTTTPTGGRDAGRLP